jgi:hypothetical protein
MQRNEAISDKSSAGWIPIEQADWTELGSGSICIKTSDGEVFLFLDARQIATSIHENGGPGVAVAVRPATLRSPAKPAVGSTHPRWIKAEEMPSMTRGWYWATFPGGWEWYSPDYNMTQGIFHGDVRWHSLMSKRYWGPFQGPPAAPA